jgi:RNA 3'-terminal phosphate cyclase (ATP)
LTYSGGGILEGGELHSSEIIYHPPASEKNASMAPVFTGTIDTAGSICLLLQAALPCILFRSTLMNETRLILKGGTNADLAPRKPYISRLG